jgi:5-methylcytosine-specific restriction endonuclease McrA
MSKLIDLSESKFGRLTVLYQVKCKSYDTVWRCKCDCGKEKNITSMCLRYGLTKSCGCFHSEIVSEKTRHDISGLRFGWLVARKYSSNDKRGSAMWECQCDCGNIKIIASRHLVSGKTKSCGCHHSDYVTTHGMSSSKEYGRVKSRKRRAMSALLDESWNLDMEMALFVMFESCIVCGSKNLLSVDHVMPLFDGNGLKPGNAVILCKRCNSAKKNRNLDNLPKSMPSDSKEKILTAARQFKEYWESSCRNGVRT